MVGFENKIFRKSFLFDCKKEALTTKILFRSYFHFKWFPERERQREEGAQITPSTSPTNPELQSNDRTHQITPVSSIIASCRLHRAARSRLRPTDLSLSLWFWFLCDFDFCCYCGGVVVVFWWLWLLIARVCCRGLNWSFGGVWCWDLAMICSVDWDLAVILKFSVIKFV